MVVCEYPEKNQGFGFKMMLFLSLLHDHRPIVRKRQEKKVFQKHFLTNHWFHLQKITSILIHCFLSKKRLLSKPGKAAGPCKAACKAAAKAPRFRGGPKSRVSDISRSLACSLARGVPWHAKEKKRKFLISSSSGGADSSGHGSSYGNGGDGSSGSCCSGGSAAAAA